MPTLQPAAAVVGTLNGLTSGAYTLTSGANLVEGVLYEVDTPDADFLSAGKVACLASGGETNEPNLGTGIDYRVKTVQVRIRSAPRDFAGGEALGVAILTALHDVALTGNLAGYAFSFVREPHPVYLYQDRQGCHHWSLNVRLGLAE